MVTRFGDYVLDSNARALFRGEFQVHLTPKALDVLLLLLSLRPRAVTKAEILDRVWPGTFVTDASLARTIHEIRSELGHNAMTPIIRTVHGHGYAFAAQATDVERAGDSSERKAVMAWLVRETRAVPLAAGELVIGRDPAVAIPVDSTTASWHHARLTASAESVTIEDLGSKNGTLVRGQPVTTAAVLKDGDDIVVGTARFIFRTGVRVTDTDTDRSR